MNTTKAKSNVRAGFTLVEILVALTTMGVLASILFAVFGRVQENGRSTVCQSKLKQLALAVQQYSQDSDGRYPNDRVQPQLFPYIKSTALIECPTHEGRSLPFPGTPDSHFYIWGYYYNGVQLNIKGKDQSGISFTGRHEASVLNTSTTWVFGDDNPAFLPTAGGGGFLAYSQCGTGQGFWATLHNGGANYAFLDGHVKWLTPSAIDRLACSPAPTS